MENNIGEARRRYAESIGKFTQEDAAEFFDVSLSTYKKWEQGQGMMNGKQLRAIANKYGVTVDYLLQINQPEKQIHQLSLPPDEYELLYLYRHMEQQQRETLIATAHAFVAASKKYEQGNSEYVGRTLATMSD